MKSQLNITIAALVLSILVACSENPADNQQPQPQPSQIAALADPPQLQEAVQKPKPDAPLPKNVELTDTPWLFSMETSPEVVELTIHGTAQERLAGRLADKKGRREIVYYGSEMRAPETVFRADWHLPAVGAVNSDGELMVCVNRLVGAPSKLTLGDMPDPGNGVDLLCKWRSGRGWSREYVVPRDVAALWLSDVVALPDGAFRIVYSKDKTGLVVDDVARGEGVYRLRFYRGHFDNPEMARRFRPLDEE